MHEHDGWWNDAVALAAEGRMPGLLRPLWWLWRIWNWNRPPSIFGPFGLLCWSLFIAYVVANASWLGIPKDRLGGAVLLAVGLLGFCLAVGRWKVKIVKRHPCAGRPGGGAASMRRLATFAVAVLLAGCGTSTHTTTVIQTITKTTPTARTATTSTIAAGGLCHGEASCGGYDNDPRDGQCGHAGQVVCANVPWGSSTASQTATQSTGRPAALGVYVQDVATSEEVALDNRSMSPEQCVTPPTGTLIDIVQPGAAAAQAGLVGGEKLVGDLGYVGGDVIVALDGNSISDTNVLQAETAQYSAGETIQVTVVHCDGEQATMPVTLGIAAPPATAPPSSSTTASNATTVPDDQDAYPDCYIGNAANPAQAVKKLPKACQ
ncbi:MAG: hypothetical protein ACLPZR_33855 [Solirubrobacteraceae bacterium]|jgi:hypothetical protein